MRDQFALQHTDTRTDGQTEDSFDSSVDGDSEYMYTLYGVGDVNLGALQTLGQNQYSHCKKA